MARYTVRKAPTRRPRGYLKKQVGPPAFRAVDRRQDRQIKQVKRAIKRIDANTELKWVDEYSTSTLIVSTGIVNNPLSPRPRVGDTVNERTGNKITMTSWRIRALFLAAPAQLYDTRIRVIALVDTQFAGVNPSLTTGNSPILDISTITDTTIAPRNLNELKRFKIFYDKLFYIRPVIMGTIGTVGAVQTLSTVQPRGFKLNIYKKMRHIVQFVTDTGALTDLTGWVPLFYAMTDRPVGYEPIMTFSSRVIYKDV